MTCANDDCDLPVPPENKKFCSERCGQRQRSKEYMRRKRAADPEYLERDRAYTKAYLAAGYKKERYATDEAYADREREISRLRMEGKRMTPEVTAIWVEWDLWRCTYCGGPFEDVDHVLAVSRGGSNDPRNLVPACWWCNRGPGGKFDREVTEWFGSRSA